MEVNLTTMNTKDEPAFAKDNRGGSAGQQTVAELESANGSPAPAPPDDTSSEPQQAILKAVFYWVLSRL